MKSTFPKNAVRLLSIFTLLQASLILSASPVVRAESRGLSCHLLPELFRIYLANHYQIHQINDEIKSRTVTQYIKMFDGSKMMLLDEDVKEIQKQLVGQFDVLFQGECPLLKLVSQKVILRAKENQAFVKAFVADKNYKLDENVDLDMDSDRRGYFKTKAEKEAFLKKFVYFQMLNYALTNTKLDESKKQLNHRYELIIKRLEEREKEDLVNLFANAFAVSLDPHSSYLSKKNLEEFEIQMKLSLEGIGAVLSSEDGYTVIEEVIPGGGADRSKQLRPKDKILSVAQDTGPSVNVMDMDLSDVVRMIRGKKGTKVSLTVLRQGGEKTERFEVVIVRDKIAMKDQEARISYEDRIIKGKKQRLAVIDLPSFYGEGRNGTKSAFRDIKTLIEEATKKDPKKDPVSGVVLNLWRNGGGLLDDAVKISGLFIRKGGVVATQNTRKEVEVLSDDNEDVSFNGPMIVLTSRLSASASEILAGALKDYHRALIVGGDHTFGKGTVQVVNQLPGDLGAIKVTTGMFFLPSGNSTQHMGVASDITLPSIYSQDDIGEKELDYSLKSQKISPFLSDESNTPKPNQHWMPVSSSLVTGLAAKSKARIDKEPKFAEILKEIESNKKNRRMIRLAEIRSKDKDEKKKNGGKEKNRADEVKDAERPYINESLNILADWISEI